MPEGVKELIGTRLARLSETANRVLTAAVGRSGASSALEVLEALLDEPEERIIAALEEAVDAGLVARGRRRRRPLRLRARARARDALRAPERDAAACALHHRIAAGARGARPRHAAPSSPTTTSRAATWTARARPSTTRAGRRRRGRRLAGLRGGRGALPARAGAPRRGDEPRRCALLLALGGAAVARRRPGRDGDVHARGRARHARTELARGARPRRARPRRRATPRRARSTSRAIALLEAALERGRRRRARRPAARAAGQRAALRRPGRAGRGAERAGAGARAPQRRSGRARRRAGGAARPRSSRARTSTSACALAHELLDLAARLGDRELKAMALHWHVYDLLEAGRRRRRAAREPRAAPTWPTSCASRPTCTSRCAGRRCGRCSPTAQEETQALIDRSPRDRRAARRRPRSTSRPRAASSRARLPPRRDRPLRRACSRRRRATRLRSSAPTCRCSRSPTSHAGDRERRRAVFARIAATTSPRSPRDMLWLGAHVPALRGLRAASATPRTRRRSTTSCSPHRDRNVMVGHGDLPGLRGALPRPARRRRCETGPPPRCTSTPRSTATPRAASTPTSTSSAATTPRCSRRAAAPATRSAPRQLRAETLAGTDLARAATQIAPPPPTRRV